MTSGPRRRLTVRGARSELESYRPWLDVAPLGGSSPAGIAHYALAYHYLVTACPSQSPLTVLDLGCHVGLFVDFLGTRGHAAIGVEKSTHLAELGRARGLDVRRGDVVDLGDLVAPASIHLAVAMRLFHAEAPPFEPVWVERFARAVRTVLRPDAALFCEAEVPLPIDAFERAGLCVRHRIVAEKPHWKFGRVRDDAWVFVLKGG